MSLDRWIVKGLNHWGANHQSLIRFLATDLVYLLVFATLVWLIVKVYRLNESHFSFGTFLRNLLFKGIFIFVVPVGFATLLSELISRIYVRERPFVAISGIKLLVSHGADGGMPSHHVVFMTAALTMIYFYSRRLALSLLALTVSSGIARVSAGVHFPTDILAGLLIGFSVSWSYFALIKRREWSARKVAL